MGHGLGRGADPISPQVNYGWKLPLESQGGHCEILPVHHEGIQLPGEARSPFAGLTGRMTCMRNYTVMFFTTG